MIINGSRSINTISLPGIDPLLTKSPRAELYFTMGMIDITGKKVLLREALASGRITLSPETVKRIRENQIKKGDPLLVAEIAAMRAAKETYLLIPHCHQIPLNTVELNFSIGRDFIEANCLVKAEAMTGVEMEALIGTSIALTTIWDMVKYIEKDKNGQYPSTRISDIRVLKKVKKSGPEPDVTR